MCDALWQLVLLLFRSLGKILLISFIFMIKVGWEECRILMIITILEDDGAWLVAG